MKMILRKYSTSEKISDKIYSAYQYCARLVKANDYDGYICTLLSSSTLRQSLYALRAFNVETSRIQDVVTNPMAGQLRSQWWRETIDKVSQKDLLDHPIALALQHSQVAHKFSPLWLKRIIDKREAHLRNSHFRSVEEVEEYAEGTAASLLYASFEMAGMKDLKTDHLASHIGKAIGISTILRGTPVNAKRGRVSFPSDLLMINNISEEMVLRRETPRGFRDACFALATRANDHLITARSILRELDLTTTQRLLVLPAVSCENFLRKLEKHDFDIFHPALSTRDFVSLWRVWISTKKRFIL